MKKVRGEHDSKNQIALLKRINLTAYGDTWGQIT